MLPASLAFTAIALSLLGCYFWRRRSIRLRTSEILSWIESTLGSRADTPLQWPTASSFRIALRTSTESMFRRSSVLVQLAPRHLPWHWLRSRLRDPNDAEETVTFEADLDAAPGFALDLHNYRLFARTRRDLEPAAGDRGWEFHSPTPMVITSRSEWGRDVTSVISSLLQLRNKHFLELRFSPASPHLSVTLPLQAIAPASLVRLEMATAIRELAVEVSSFHGLSS